MFTKWNRFTVIVILAISGLAVTASAQSKPQVPEAAAKTTLRAGNGMGDTLENSRSGQAWVLGWNYVHATNCSMFDNSGYTFFVVYPVEGGFFYTVFPLYQAALAPACQAGNWVAIHVVDGYGGWDQLVTFDYR